MKTNHNIHIGRAQEMHAISDNSIDLIVTSPPYPMIEMWDDILANQNAEIAEALEQKDGLKSFELMHKELDKVWSECFRVLKDGGIACINIGDATRTINGNFAIYSNHARIISCCINLGFVNLPNIIWRKQTNAPNKFMGSGMLPGGAYVTLEHEWILVFRKGNKRNFKTEKEKSERRKSAYFWEERNVWFSDVWDLKGTKQKLDTNATRERSAAYPLMLPYRLINMYSIKGDTVLDPFMGTGTTSIASILSQRNSVGYDIDSHFAEVIAENIQNLRIDQINQIVKDRIISHNSFIQERLKDQSKNPIKHFNNSLELPVMTSQEKEIEFCYVENICKTSTSSFEISYSPSGVLPFPKGGLF